MIIAILTSFGINCARFIPIIQVHIEDSRLGYDAVAKAVRPRECYLFRRTGRALSPPTLVTVKVSYRNDE
jgi:hypothetical protein